MLYVYLYTNEWEKRFNNKPCFQFVVCHLHIISLIIIICVNSHKAACLGFYNDWVWFFTMNDSTTNRPGWWPMLWKPYPYASILIYTKTHSKAKQSFKISFWLIIPDRTGIIIITTWQEVYSGAQKGIYNLEWKLKKIGMERDKEW